MHHQLKINLLAFENVLLQSIVVQIEIAEVLLCTIEQQKNPCMKKTCGNETPARIYRFAVSTSDSARLALLSILVLPKKYKNTVFELVTLRV